MKKQSFVANPLYDSVFKFMMEDEQVAHTLLSALLKKDIVSVEMRPNEYSNANKDNDRISIFRIDFGALVREKDGKEHLILIEVQKTWRSTEISRFRQYLGVQYENKRNLDVNGNSLPIVSIYILGHKVGKIKEPVVYVSRKYLDYDSKEITEGVPDPFVESLTHDSIIVQVPYLKGKARNRVEKLLSVFDQTYVQDGDPQFVSVSDRDISEDKDMERIINRLAKAATISDIRMTMNIEDEIYSELENLDTKILSQKKALAQKDKQLAHQEEQLAHQEEQLAHQEEQLAHQKDMLRFTIKMLVESGKTLSEIADNLHLDIEDIKELM
jgi:hypothetical protein